MNLIINQVEKKFPEINNEKNFKAYCELCEMYILKEYLKNRNFITDEDMLRIEGGPFNFFAMVANGKIPNVVDQSIIGDYSKDWMICHNKPENDENWNNEEFPAGSMAEADENGPGHVFITTKRLHMKYFNILAIALDGNVELLKEMKKVAMRYAKKRNWSNPGFYFHCFPYNSVQSLHLHVVNLDRTGINYENYKYKNLSIEDAITAIEKLYKFM